MNEEINAMVRTKDEVNNLIDLIDRLLASLYEDHGRQYEKVLNEEFPKDLADELREEIKETSNKTEYLEKLKGELSKLESLKLTLSFKPTEKDVKKIYEWVYANVGKGMIIDFGYDKNILGGAIISFKGEYRDYSVKKKLEKNREQYLKEILTSLEG
jgi:F0F1-type ATP synthase delta subunit